MENNKLRTFKKEMQDVLTGNILPFWIENMVDRQNGGFYGRIDGHGNLYADVADYATKKNGSSSTGLIFSS